MRSAPERAGRGKREGLAGRPNPAKRTRVSLSQTLFRPPAFLRLLSRPLQIILAIAIGLAIGLVAGFYLLYVTYFKPR